MHCKMQYANNEVIINKKMKKENVDDDNAFTILCFRHLWLVT